MPISDYFADDYAGARAKFLSAAGAAGAALHCYAHPSLHDPAGGPLATDVAVIGPASATRCLLVISGTHGVEGFAGSGCQVGFFHDALYRALGSDVRAVLVHALNPYGFAWIRRVNEDNVDLNRNFQDFTRPLPHNAAYEPLHGLLIPPDWDGAGRRAADAQLAEFLRSHGLAALQTAVSAGQYAYPDGLFYGGVSETWSNATFRRIVAAHVAPATGRLVVLDLHTGLGPFAYGEPILVGGGEQSSERARTRFGAEIKSLESGESSSSVLTGTLEHALHDGAANRDGAADRDITFFGLEFGTKPIVDVLAALRGDHWLHTAKNVAASLRDRIKTELRDAFYVDAPHWKAAVYGRMADFVLRSARVLAEA